jgi:hypothetical protein
VVETPEASGGVKIERTGLRERFDFALRATLGANGNLWRADRITLVLPAGLAENRSS